MRVTRTPRPLRRLVWWFGLNGSGRKGAHHFGTFGVTAHSGLGATSLHSLAPLTTAVYYGVAARDGTVDVRLIYNLRAMDGARVVRALPGLERVSTCEILAALRCLPGLEAA